MTISVRSKSKILSVYCINVGRRGGCLKNNEAEIARLSEELASVQKAYQELLAKFQKQEEKHLEEINYLIDWYYQLSGQKCPLTLNSQQIGRKIRHYLDFILARVPLNMFWVDVEGVILGYTANLQETCNMELLTTFPLSRHPHVGKKLSDLLDPEIASEVLANNAEVFAGNITRDFEEYVPSREGGEKVFLTYKTPVFDDEGAKIGLVGVSVDITERKSMEEDLRRAKERAEASHMAKVQFLKNMQHDVRTPLSCITGSVKILRKMEHNPEKLEFLDGILCSGENLLKMLTKMLEYDHMRADERPLQYQFFKTRTLMSELAEMFTFPARQKGLMLNCDVAEDVPENLFTDCYRFQRVLMNLINNAIKFTHEGQVGLNVRMQDPSWLECTIKDTGIGIDQNKQEQIFEKYVRVAPADQNRYQGEGIGLHIVKQFTEELGGRIALESQLGQGATFTVLLPLKCLST